MVFLPYLAAIERIVLAMNAIRSGNASGTFSQFVADPTLWFAERGVEEVTYILGDEDGDIGDENLTPNIPNPSTELPSSIESFNLDLGWMRRIAEKIRAPKKHKSGLDPFQRDHTSRNRQNRVTRGSALPHQMPFVISPGAEVHLNWMFLPFVHPDLSRRKRFLDALHKEFPNTRLQSRPLKLGKDPINVYLSEHTSSTRTRRGY